MFCEFAFYKAIYEQALIAYVVAHHEGKDFCQWPRLVG